jgi:hypothetical protein
MKATHREQIDFIKKRISKGNKGKELLRRFRRRWDLSTKTFKRRLAIARHEILHGSSQAAPAWVLLSMPGGTDVNGQKAENSREQKSADKEGQYNSPVTGQNTTEVALKNSTATEGQKTENAGGQKSTETEQQEKKLQEAAERLLYTSALSTDDCLFMLTRLSMGQLARRRHIVCNRQVVEVEETPGFSQRRTALMAILKYRTSGKQADEPDNSKYLLMDPDEMANISTMSAERYAELIARFNALD